MTWFVTTGLTNAGLASVLAGIAWAVGRRCRRPALTRLLWIVVLCKLVTPPVAKAPVGDWLEAPKRWLAVLSLKGDPSQPRPVDDGVLRASGDPRTGTASAAGDAADRVVSVASVRTPSSGQLRSGDAAVSAMTRPEILGRLAALSPTAYLQFAASVWLCGSVVCLVWLVSRACCFRRFLARAARRDEELGARVARLAREAGMNSVPRVMVVESAVSPMLWGAGRNACLVFPAELTRRIDAASCNALLLHELAHFARGDWLVRLLELAAQVLYWWCPLVWWARREIEAAEEECCDAWVVRRTQSRRLYAEALLSTLDFLCEPLRPLPPAACGLGGVPLLRWRLTQIMCGEVDLRPSRATKTLVLAAAAVVLPLRPAFVGPSLPEAAARSTPSPETVLPQVPAPAIVNEVESTNGAAEAPAAERKPGSWFVAREAFPRVGPVVYATAVSPDGRYKLQARTGHRAALIDVESEKSVDLSTYRIISASFSPDSRFLATAQDDESVVRVWDSKTAVVQSLLRGSEAAIASVAFAPDGKRVAAGAIDGGVLVWDVKEQELLGRLALEDAPVSCLRWSKQNDRLAIAWGSWSNRDSSSLAVWRPTEDQVSEKVSLDDSTGAIDWLTDDELIVADWSGEARVFDLRSSVSIERLWLGKDQVSAAAFSPDCPLPPRWQAGKAGREAAQ